MNMIDTIILKYDLVIFTFNLENIKTYFFQCKSFRIQSNMRKMFFECIEFIHDIYSKIMASFQFHIYNNIAFCGITDSRDDIQIT